MFWDGTRWVDESERSPVHPRPRRRPRFRDLAATGIMAIALVGLIVPMVGTSAAGPPSGQSLLEDWSAGGSVKTYNENHERVAYRGKWTRADHPNYIDGHVRFTDGRKAKASLKFKGSAVSWIGPVGPTRGKARIYINGKYVKTVDTYASTFKPARVLFKATWKTAATRRITIVSQGTKGRSTVALDAFIVRTSGKAVAPEVSKPKPKPDPTNVPQRNPKVLLSEDIGPVGTKTVLSLSGFAGGTSGEIMWDGSSDGMPTYTTEPDGKDKVSLIVPLSATVGKHEIDTYGPDGEHLMMRIFEVTPGDSGRSGPTPTPTTAPSPTPAPTAAPTSTPKPTAAPTSTPQPTAAPTKTPTPTATPTKTPAPSTTYAAVFGGDASGATDVTSSLRSFLQSHNGQKVALATNGVYKVTQLTFTASNLTVDFRGARLQGSQVGAHGILKIQSSTNLVLNDPKVYGTGYVWADNTQWEHGIHVDGGSNITINDPITRDTRGDGILTGYDPGRTTIPTGVVINRPNIERAARNGIAPVGGEVTIRGGHIANVGLHGIDFEPNDAKEAGSIRALVDGVDIRRYGDRPVGYTGYAISAGWGYLGTMKPSVVLQNNTGDRLSIVVMNTSVVKILNNTSDASAIAEIIDSSNITYSGNVRITRR